MIGIIDYNAGNIRSVERALQHLKLEYKISKNPHDLIDVDKLIFPGVGEASFAMKQLETSGFDLFLKDYAKSGKPLLGICLGSQIVLDASEEGEKSGVLVKCLGLIPGTVKKFPASLVKNGFKIPHMGWNSVSLKKECPLFKGIKNNSDFYFVHSYYLEPSNKDYLVGVTDYDMEVPCVLQKENVFALQFHPEKSGKDGLQIISNFANL